MGNGSSTPGDLDPNTFQGDPETVPANSPTGCFGKEEELNGDVVYFCCYPNGNAYRRTPDHCDVNTEVPYLGFKESVRPVKQIGHWIKVAEHQWLPLVFFWGPKQSNGEHTELMRHYGSAPDAAKPGSKSVGGYASGWNVVDKTVRDVQLNDTVDDALDALDAVRVKAVLRLQAAERGRQERKKRRSKKQKKKKKQKQNHPSL